MVLCKFFQQGNCRFGSKCNNEHFDLKQLIKTDVESAVNGKQWPLSCFGPFKDKPCIPNFIDDQSFEEVRYLCYDSKQKNYFQQFHQQFTKEALEATNKMKTLMQLTPDVIEVISKIYDSSTEVTNNNSTQINNPFGMQTSGAQAGSIFAKSTASTGNTTAGNIFGGSFQTTNPATTANIFGGTNNNSNIQQNSIFGGGIAGSTTTAFGATATPTQQQGSLFGQTTLQQQQQGNSIFGSSVTPQKNIFGQVTNPAISTTPFGQPAATPQTNIFNQQSSLDPGGQAQANFNIFGQNTQQNSSIFAPQQPTAIAPNSNPFGQPQQQPQMPQNTGLFGQALATTQQQPTNVFGQAIQTQQQGTGLFGSVAPPIQPQQQFQQQAQDNQNLFGQMQQSNSGIGANGNNFFGQAVIQQGPQQQQPPHQLQAQNNENSARIYSRMEDLTIDEIEAFKADFFSVGKLPLSLPPRELC